jgi:hypothetical protein
LGDHEPFRARNEKLVVDVAICSAHFLSLNACETLRFGALRRDTTKGTFIKEDDGCSACLTVRHPASFTTSISKATAR